MPELRFLSPGAKVKLAAWWQASRPPFYIATLIPLLLGWLSAWKDYGAWQPGLFCLILLCSFFLHLSANLANDLFDHLQGIDSQDSIGGSRAIQEGKIPLKTYVRALLILYAASLAMAFLGVLHTGRQAIWPIVIFAILASHFYVAPPIKYGHRALGELFVFLSMGLIMTAGTYYTLTGVWSGSVIALSLPVGLMVAGILYYQSLPEIEADKAVGKHTLANMLGPHKAFLLFRLWWPFVWLLMLALFLKGICAWPVLAGILGAFPFYRKTVAILQQEETRGDWLSLDAHGHLVRKMYLICGVALIASVAIR